MILDLDRHALVAGIERGTLGHRPGLQHPIELEAKVVVQSSRRVLLHHEQQRAVALTWPRFAGGSGVRVKVRLAA